MRFILNNMCNSEKPRAKAPLTRSSIWHLPANQRCAVIGTCVDIEQLRKILNRFPEERDYYRLKTDYELHSFFVSACGERNAMSRLVNKWLNHRFRSFMQDAAKLKSVTMIMAAWEGIPSTDLRALSGYFWAFLTSKYCDDDLRNHIYGDIHMISHIAGRQHNSEIDRLNLECNGLKRTIEKKDRIIQRKNEQLEQQREDLAALRKKYCEQKQLSRNQIAGKKPAKAYDIERYKTRLERQRQLIARLQRRLQEQQRLAVKPPAVTGGKNTAPNTTASCDHDCEHCTEIDLCGKQILYVGGFSRHRNSFRQLTESYNGKFLYHDGGKQQSEHQLDDLVRKADAVFCPVDCISHNAMGRIKTLAKSQCKDCVFLKSASVSSFRNEVVRYAS